MKIQLGLRAGIALPLLATLIVGMSVLVIFNYFSQVNVMKEQEIREVQFAINTTNVLWDISPLSQEFTNTNEIYNFFERFSDLEKFLNKLKKAINSDVGFITNKEILPASISENLSKNTFGQWVSIYYTGKDPKQFISEKSITKINQAKDKYYLYETSINEGDYYVIYVPIQTPTGKNLGYIYITKERILSNLAIIKILGVNILAYVVILILISLLIGYGMHKYVIDPILALTKVADDISMGNIGEKVNIKNARGEIAILAKSIERMRITMKKLLE